MRGQRRTPYRRREEIAPAAESRRAGGYLGGLIFLPVLALVWLMAKGLPAAWQWITAAIERWLHVL